MYGWREVKKSLNYEIMLESDIQKQILLAASKANARLFRNNVGTGWIGQVKRTSDGSIILLNPRPLHAGLCVGSSDLIGWKPVTITPDMVGKKIAQFTAVEVKLNARPTKEQLNFINVVNNSGGNAGIAHTPQEVYNLLTQIKLL
jgi:ribosomal protein S19